MICALLVFQTADLPAPLGELSPWLDWLITPRERGVGPLAAQQHRRFIKTHTPLDGIPLDAAGAYIVVARHPLDMAVSLYHQGDNIDRDRMRELTGAAAPSRPTAAGRRCTTGWCAWIETRHATRARRLDSLPGVLWHLSDAWAAPRASQRAAGALRRLPPTWGGRCGGSPPARPRRAGRAVAGAGGGRHFDRMRGNADRLVPTPRGVEDHRAFFRRGRSGAGRGAQRRGGRPLPPARAAWPRPLLAWLHRALAPGLADAGVGRCGSRKPRPRRRSGLGFRAGATPPRDRRTSMSRSARSFSPRWPSRRRILWRRGPQTLLAAFVDRVGGRVLTTLDQAVARRRNDPALTSGKLERLDAAAALITGRRWGRETRGAARPGA